MQETTIKFTELPLSIEIQNALADMNFVDASPIQSSAIPIILEGKDVIGQAQTGTGKTAAFAIPAIEMLDPDDRSVQALIMCPTRELALQVSEEFKKLLKYKKNLRVLPVFGGASIEKQIQELRRGVHIVVGTPGRIMDHLDRGTLSLDTLQMVILDEADEMLNMGFVDDIQSILSTAPEERQTVLFSATMPKPILDLTKKFQKNPELVKVTKKELTTTNIEQFYFELKSQARTEAMTRIIDMHGLKLMLVFCNTKAGVDQLVEDLQSRNISAEGLHGDMRQQQRNNVLSKFKMGIINTLVATDVAARGIDVDNVDAVFNFDVPLDQENYVHRIGRTGRAGKAGKSFTFVSSRKDTLKLKDILNYTKANIEKGEVPSQEEITDFRKRQFIEKLTNQLYSDEIKEFVPLAEEIIEAGLSPKNVIAALLKNQLGKIHKKYADENFKMEDRRDRFEGGDRRDRDRGRGDRETRGSRGGFERDRSDRGSERSGSERPPRTPRGDISNMVRLNINIGRNQRVRPGDIVGAIAGESGIDGQSIGDIEIRDRNTFVYIPKKEVDKVLDSMTGNTIKGYRINLEVVN